jgi:hypothetical protein
MKTSNAFNLEMSKDLANRLREVLLDGHWIASTNFKEQITNTNWKQAVEKLEGLNTIASLTFHINYYLKGVLDVFQGGDLVIQDKHSFDMPDISSESEWMDLVNEFLNNAELYISHVERMYDQQLSQSFVKDEYGSYSRNIEAQIEHSYYHLGQIVLIKKLVTQRAME